MKFQISNSPIVSATSERVISCAHKWVDVRERLPTNDTNGPQWYVLARRGVVSAHTYRLEPGCTMWDKEPARQGFDSWLLITPHPEREDEA